MEKPLQPLVSVIVITYNSSSTVLETLDSIYNQTYPNIELIVSDDCSPDNTVEICQKWIVSHKDRFARTELLTVEKNTGVSANLNRAEDACRGEWVKEIAGDDILLPECVDIFMDYVKEHPDTVYMFSDVELFGGDEETRKELDNWYSSMEKPFFSWSNEKQIDQLTLARNPIPTPTAFYHRGRVVALGVRNDERIPFYEDRPKWVNFLKKGVRFGYIDKVTVRYRLSDSSLCRKTPEKFVKSQAYFYLYYCFSNEYKKGSKKHAVRRWFSAQRIVHDNAIRWRVAGKMYRAMFNAK